MVAPAPEKLRIVILGLSITSSWGNGHATTYRGLVRALCRRGHEVLFLERETPWYRAHRDLPQPPFGTTALYDSHAELHERWRGAVREADLVIVGSYVPEGIAVAQWAQRSARGLVAFYDIDTPVTLAALAAGTCEYLDAELIPGFDLYLSFTGGPTLRRIEAEYGALAARALYCSVDPDCHRPQAVAPAWDIGYLGTYSADRQATLDRLLCQPAQRWPQGRFAVAGSLYPADAVWPANVERIEHIDPTGHAAFYGKQRFTLNVTRADMISCGWSPSVRLFEAAACGVPIVSDWWPGLDEFFHPGEDILIARTTEAMLEYLRDLPDGERLLLASNARHRVFAAHTAEHRAAELEAYVAEARVRRRGTGRRAAANPFAQTLPEAAG
ncbi:MAG TPA: glycosyltransferase [Stellaceae bacterium]|jgi:spore maturation protein CgeB|nr:glycosyltransferase [Stellaceae bacterium]